MDVILLKEISTGREVYRKGTRLTVDAKTAARWAQHGLAEPTTPAKTGSSVNCVPGLTSIIVPIWNALPDLKNCLRAVKARTKDEDFELILVDNGSDADTRRYLGIWKRAKVIHNKQNEGFARACNQGILNAQGEYLVFLNSDTIVTDGWLDTMKDALRVSGGGGLCGPTTNYSMGPQCDRSILGVNFRKVAACHHWKDFETKEIDAIAAKYQGQSPEPVRELSGFCLMVTRSVIDAIGGFDAEAFPFGGGEDIDFEWRARRAGFPLVWARGAYVHHAGHQSLKNLDDPQKVGKENHAKAKQREARGEPMIVPLYRPDVVPVLFPTWDRFEYTKKALTQLMHTKDVKFVVSIIDDHSDDYGMDTWLKRQLSRENVESVIRRPKRKGIDAASARFFADTKGLEWIAKVDNDTLVPDYWLKKMIDVANEKSLYVVGADHDFGRPEARKIYYTHSEPVPDGSKIWLHRYVGGSGILIRRSFIDEMEKVGCRVWPDPSKISMEGWTYFQTENHKRKMGMRIAFYDGVRVKLQDQDGDGVRVEDYPEYNDLIHETRMANRKGPKSKRVRGNADIVGRET